MAKRNQQTDETEDIEKKVQSKLEMYSNVKKEELYWIMKQLNWTNRTLAELISMDKEKTRTKQSVSSLLKNKDFVPFWIIDAVIDEISEIDFKMLRQLYKDSNK